jgi:hypothetical protein
MVLAALLRASSEARQPFRHLRPDLLVGSQQSASPRNNRSGASAVEVAVIMSL